MHAPFRQAYASAMGPHRASFHAKATKVDLSMGVTFGRTMAGFEGMGTVEVVPAGVRIVARRYRYWTHGAAGLVLGVGVTIGVSLVASAGKTDAAELALVHKGAMFWGAVAALLASWLAAASIRFFAPVTAIVDRASVQHAQMIGPRLRIFATSGDVELWLPEAEALHATLRALAALGVPMR